MARPIYRVIADFPSDSALSDDDFRALRARVEEVLPDGASVAIGQKGWDITDDEAAEIGRQSFG